MRISGRAKNRRNQRAALIAERLEKAHIPGALEGALRLAGGGAVTRGHFARFLVEAGRANNIADVFKNTWRGGKPDTFLLSGVQ